MKEPSFIEQKEKYLNLLQEAEDLLDDDVSPGSIVEFLDGRKNELSIAYPFYGLFCSFLSANMA